MSKLSGKTALVTGASKGIGAEIARALAAAGASVAVNYASSRDGAEKVVADITGNGGRAVAVGGDVGKSGEAERLVAEAARALGPIDILVNNAGVYAMQPIEEVTEEAFHRHFDINVLGLLMTSRAFVRQIGADGGSIINISSVVTKLNPPGSAIYTATKGAVDSITRVLANELGSKKVRVNAINPGIVVTEGTHTAGFIGSEFEKQAIARTPLGRVGHPNDIAPLAVFLASDDAGWVTGETLTAAGGA